MFREFPHPHRSRLVFFLTPFLVIANTFVYLPPKFLPSLSYQKTEKRVPKPSAPAEGPEKENPSSHNPAPRLITRSADEPAPQALAVEAYGNLPMSFEANHGQTKSEIKFLSRGPGYSLSLSSTEATFHLTKLSGKRLSNKARPSPQTGGQESTTQTSVVSMTILRSNGAPRIEGLDELAGSSNYLIGNDPDKWQINVPNYARVKYTDVYPGVDLLYYGNQRQLEYDFVVAPGASPSSIRLAFRGVQSTHVDARGDLVLRVVGGEIRQRKPVVYQETGGVKEYVEGRYLLKGRHEVGFEIAAFDASKPLVIDPILVYSSILGGASFGHAITVDDFGNVYLTGETTSNNLPIRNPFQSVNRGNTNAFVTKINAAGTEILYSTYLGGSFHDRAHAIAVDSAGNAYLTGTTSSTDFPTLNPIQPELITQFPGGGVDVFITKLNARGSGLMFSTYLGGPGFDIGYGIAVDSSGNTYLTGEAMSDWPTTVQAFQPNHAAVFEAFITKLSPSGTQILYSTYLGGRADDFGGAIAVDASENAYITGYTNSSLDFPVRNALQPQFGGGESDAFVAKIPTVPAPFVFPLDSFDEENGGMPAPSYSNFSNWNVTAGQVDLQLFNSNDNLMVNLDVVPSQGATIETKSPLVLSPGTYRLRFDLAIRTVADTVTVRLGNVFRKTFSGSSGTLETVVTDVLIATQTSAKLSFEFAGGLGNGIYLDNVGFFARNGHEYVTFLGGSAEEDARTAFSSGIKVDGAGNAYVTGITASIDFPRVNAIQRALAGGTDVFVSKLNPLGSALVYSTYLGGSGGDAGNDISTDQDGNAYVVGNTMSTNFPVKNAVQPTFGGDTQFGGDAFITKLNATGNTIIYSTYLGGAGTDVAEDVAIDAWGNAFVTGYTRSVNFPLTNALPSTTRGAFFLKVPRVTGTGEPDIFAVAPTAGGNNGSVTMRIIGDNFETPPLSVKLIGNGFPELSGAHLFVENSSALLSTFDLRGAPPGLRDVEVVFSDNRVLRLIGVFTVEAGGGPRVWVDVIGRDVIRSGQRQSYTLSYGNRGNVDGGAVLLSVSGTNGTRFAFPNSEHFQDSPVRIFAVGTTGSAGRLMPGTAYSQSLVVMLPPGVTQATISVGIVETSGQPFDWGRLASEGLPLGAAGVDWTARVALARSRIGESWDDVMATLRQVADVAEQPSEALTDFDSLLRYIVIAYGSPPTEFGGASPPETELTRLPQLTQVQDGNVVPVGEEVPNPEHIIIITHGYGGTRDNDDFHKLANKIKTLGNVNVYRIEWNQGSNRKLMIAPGIFIPWPPFSQLAINPTAAVAAEQLRARGLDPSKATFVGESFGNYVNYRIAELLGGAQNAAIFNPANELGFYTPPDFRKVFKNSYSFHTYSLWDTNRDIAQHQLFIRNTDGLSATAQHQSGIPRLLLTLEQKDLSWLFLTRTLPSLPPGFFDGVWEENGGFTPSPLASGLDPLYATLAPVPREFRQIDIRVVQSFDPNIKIGSPGVLTQRYLSGIEPLRYLICFENLATALAPAQEVVITDQLDTAQLDLNTFALGPMTFGGKQVVPPASLSEFNSTIDLRPENNLLVNIDVRLNKVTGLLMWQLTSIDPGTGRPPENPFAGFLPPNIKAPEGEGSVFFTIKLRSALPTGSEIHNAASIVFDNNAAIQTESWLNTLDNSPPASHVHALPATQSSASFNVQWSVIDIGAGISDYTIYVSDNGGPFTPWLTTTGTQATFVSAVNHTYAFFSVARDKAGNTEVVKAAAEAKTRIVSIASIDGRVTGSGGNTLSHVTITLSGSRSATASTDADGNYSFADLPAGSYTVTPSKTNYTFNPTNLIFNDLSGNRTGNFAATVISGAPILISEETSTRAIAIDSALWLRDPFHLNSPVPWGLDRRTRIMLFAMNLEFQPGENISLLTADAEDTSHRIYPLIVEYAGTVPGFTWLSCVVVRLEDDMNDIGDVLVRIRLRGVPSNRVRLGIGHNGGGPPDDIGAAPTPGRQP
jgi:Carboxypeptidase regulatory-like domain/Beta-propeller repeat